MCDCLDARAARRRRKPLHHSPPPLASPGRRGQVLATLDRRVPCLCDVAAERRHEAVVAAVHQGLARHRHPEQKVDGCRVKG